MSRTILFAFSFILIFLLMYPIHKTCDMNDCLKGAIAFAFLFAYGKYNEYEYLKGKAFYGLYFYGGKIPSIKDDSSDKNRRIRGFHFLSLIIMDIFVIVFIVKYSWLFN